MKQMKQHECMQYFSPRQEVKLLFNINLSSFIITLYNYHNWTLEQYLVVCQNYVHAFHQGGCGGDSSDGMVDGWNKGNISPYTDLGMERTSPFPLPHTY